MKNKSHSKLKAIFRTLHLWLGLATGLIVFIVAITGCIFVFHDEIKDLTYDWRKLTPENKSFVSPSKLFNKAEQLYPGTQSDLVVYHGKERPALVYKLIDGVPHNIYFNPYSGEFIHLERIETEFFKVIESLHMYLLLPEAFGRQIVGISTLIFLFMLISGLVLWYPKNWKKGIKNFKIKWNARWRRINYDWHKTTGLYICALAFIIALTGLSFSYEWMHSAFYTVGNLGEKPSSDTYVSNFKSDTITDMALDQAFKQTHTILPKSGMLFIMKQAKDLPIISGAYPNSLEFHHQSNLYFHPETGVLLAQHLYTDKSSGLQLQEMNYGLHTGQYFGTVGKIIAFIVSLFVAGLPVSGFIIWWGRTKKSKNRKLPKA